MNNEKNTHMVSLVLFVGKSKFTNFNHFQPTSRTLLKKYQFQPIFHYFNQLLSIIKKKNNSTHFNKKYALQSISTKRIPSSTHFYQSQSTSSIYQLIFPNEKNKPLVYGKQSSAMCEEFSIFCY